MPAPDTSGLVNELKFWQPPTGKAGLAIRLDELQARAKVDGAAIDVYALAQLVSRLNELGAAERAYVLRQLAAGQPATVTRPPRAGEPSGQARTQTYFLVQHPLPTAADVRAQQAATAAQMTTTNQATVRAGPSPDSAAGAFTDVFAQAKLDFLDGAHGVRQRLDAAGVHGFHLLDDVEEAVDLSQHALAFERVQFQPSEVGDAGDVLGGQCHGGKNRCKRDNLARAGPVIHRGSGIIPPLVLWPRERPFCRCAAAFFAEETRTS